VEDTSSRYKTKCNRLSRHRLLAVLSTIIIMALSAGVTHLSVAAVYECRDAAGKSVLTNRQVGLHSCRSIIKEAVSLPTSPESNMTPEQPSATVIPNESSDAHYPSTELPTWNPNEGPDSPPQPHSSCRQGVNPLNPLIATPCPPSYPSP
jgi:hypothetical protein